MFARWAGGETRHTHTPGNPWKLQWCHGPVPGKERTFILPQAAGSLPPLCSPSPGTVSLRPLPANINFVTLLRSAQSMGSQPRHGDMQGGMVSTTVGVGTFSTQTRKNHWRFRPWFSALPRAIGRARVVFCLFVVSNSAAQWPIEIVSLSALRKKSKHINSSCADYRGCLG